MEEHPLPQPEHLPQMPENSLQNHQPEESIEANQQDSLLLDVADTSGYDKNLKNARVWLYIITAMQIVMGIYESTTLKDSDTVTKWVVFLIDAVLGLLFLACALWSYKKPYPAFIVALVLYIIITVTGFVLAPSNINFGIIVKIFVVIALFRAIKDARDMEELKSSFNIYS